MNRIRQNLNLALILTFGIVTSVMITPFAIYRLLSGQIIAGYIDLLIVACISLGSVHAYVTGRTQGAALFLAITYSSGCIAFAHVAGAAGPLWMYAVLLSNFLLVGRKRATLISALPSPPSPPVHWHCRNCPKRRPSLSPHGGLPFLVRVRVAL
ncbi:MAG: hypothetical protein IPH43_03330 [Xanthomonadales bacterium]|nr:hypothetical protein [Xanthomonadales bacterium]